VVDNCDMLASKKPILITWLSI